MTKVLHLTPGIGPAWYGLGVGLDDLCRALAARHCDVTLATAYRSALDDPERVLPSITERDRGYSRMAFPVLATRRFQLSPALLCWLAVNISQFDIVHLNSLYSFPIVAGLILARRLKIPYVVTTHDVLAPVQRRKSRAKKFVVDSILIRRALNAASAIVYSTLAEYEAARPLGIRAPSAIVPWAINLTSFAALPKRGSFRTQFLNGSGCPIVLYLGRLAEKKGLDRLLQAFKKVLVLRPDARLVVAGGGDPPAYRSLVERWAETYGVSSSALFTGFVDGMDKLALLADADVFVLPSQSENFAVAMFEAMACRLPVVVSSGVQLSSNIVRCGAGLVADDPCEIADAICRVISDVNLRRALAEGGFNYARGFGWDNTAAALANLYSEILGANVRLAPSLLSNRRRPLTATDS